MGYIDVHCHVLPQVDDGSQSMDETLDMLKIAYDSGISDMIVTPHYKKGRVGTPREKIGEMIQVVQSYADEEGIPVTLHPGTEIYYNSSLEERLESGWLARMNDTDYVLVEFSPLDPFPYIRNAIDDVFSLGYRPIIAHVERYECMLKRAENVRILHDMGCLVQVNAGSIAGNYGFMVKHFTRKLLKEKLVEFVGTDAHNTEGRKPDMKKCAEIIYKKCDRAYADAILFGNAEEILQIGVESGEEY